jgi:hypothetical protein
MVIRCVLIRDTDSLKDCSIIVIISASWYRMEVSCVVDSINNSIILIYIVYNSEHDWRA